MTIRVDLHVHTKVSKTIPFRLEAFRRTVGRAMQVGLDGFAITEHIHAIDYWDNMQLLARLYGYRDGHLFVAPGFNVITGTEVTVADAADLIVIGPLDALDRFDSSFPRRLSEGHSPLLVDMLEPARAEQLVVIGAHPTRPGKRLVDVGPELLSKLDALEVNGKDMASGPVDATIKELAQATCRPVVGSSDAHLWPQVGVQRTLLPMSQLSQDGLRYALGAGATAPESTPSTRRIVGMCQTHKRLIKASRSARGRRRVRPAARPAWTEAAPLAVGI
jgi:hypothetical protein